jgi:tetratricopeptide (TPR) repeat protein
MPQRRFHNERAALGQWLGILCVVGVAALGVNIGVYRHVEDLRASSPWTYVRQGMERMRANDFDAALIHFRKGAEVAPSSPLPHEHMGLLHYERQDFAKAASAYERAVELGSRSADARGKLLWAYIHTRQYDAAVALGERSINERLATEQFPRWIAEAHYRAGRMEDSIRYFEVALQNQEDLYVMSKLLSAYEKTGRTKQAEALRQRIEVLEAS